MKTFTQRLADLFHHRNVQNVKWRTRKRYPRYAVINVQANVLKCRWHCLPVSSDLSCRLSSSALLGRTSKPRTKHLFLLLRGVCDRHDAISSITSGPEFHKQSTQIVKTKYCQVD